MKKRKRLCLVILCFICIGIITAICINRFKSNDKKSHNKENGARNSRTVLYNDSIYFIKNRKLYKGETENTGTESSNTTETSNNTAENTNFQDISDDNSADYNSISSTVDFKTVEADGYSFACPKDFFKTYEKNESKELTNHKGYIIDCLYRFCSFKRKQVEPRSYESFLKDA